MSLTHLLSNVPEVRERFKSEFTKPKFTIKSELLAPPVTNNPTIIGIAFDYLLRFFIQCLNPKKIIAREWIVQGASAPDIETLRKFDGIRLDAHEQHQKYLTNGKLTDALLRAVLRLPKLDVYRRYRFVKEELDFVPEEDIADMKKLISLVSPMMFKAKDLVLLNPTFGEGTSKIGGADADLLLDDTLLEIKTIRKFHFPRDHFNQLMGYYALHEIYGIGDLKPKPEIKKIGVYFSRYAYLYTFDVSDVINEDTFPEFKSWFDNYLSEFQERRKKATRKRSLEA